MALSLFNTRFNLNVARRLHPSLTSLRRYSAAQNTKHEVEYPPILDLGKKACAEREKLAWHEQVKKLNTIEEKLLKVNMPAYYGLRTTPLVNDEYHYNCFPYFQHWTRTQYETGIPANWCKQSSEQIDGLVNTIRDQIIEAISFQFHGCRREYENDVNLSVEEKRRLKSAAVCQDLHRIIMKHLYGVAPHLIESEVDIEPRHEAFWMAGGKPLFQLNGKYLLTNDFFTGIEPPTDKKIWIERKVPLTEEELNEPIDRPFQYVGE